MSSILYSAAHLIQIADNKSIIYPPPKKKNVNNTALNAIKPFAPYVYHSFKHRGAILSHA